MVGHGALLDESNGLEGERGERGVGAAEAGAEDHPRRLREGVVQPEAGQEAEQQRAGDVDDEGSPGEHALGAIPDGAVDEVPQRRPDGGSNNERRPRHEAHVVPPLPAGGMARASTMPAHTARKPASRPLFVE